MNTLKFLNIPLYFKTLVAPLPVIGDCELSAPSFRSPSGGREDCLWSDSSCAWFDNNSVVGMNISGVWNSMSGTGRLGQLVSICLRRLRAWRIIKPHRLQIQGCSEAHRNLASADDGVSKNTTLSWLVTLITRNCPHTTKY